MSKRRALAISHVITQVISDKNRIGLVVGLIIWVIGTSIRMSPWLFQIVKHSSTLPVAQGVKSDEKSDLKRKWQAPRLPQKTSKIDTKQLQSMKHRSISLYINNSHGIQHSILNMQPDSSLIPRQPSRKTGRSEYTQ